MSGIPSCPAKADNNIDLYPGKKPKKKRPTKHTSMYLICSQAHQVLLQKRPQSGVWAGLWSLPESLDDIPAQNPQVIAKWPVIEHTFSHFQLNISPIECGAQASTSTMEPEQWLWYDLQQPAAIGLAAPVAKLLARLTENLADSERHNGEHS